MNSSHDICAAAGDGANATESAATSQVLPWAIAARLSCVIMTSPGLALGRRVLGAVPREFLRDSSLERHDNDNWKAFAVVIAKIIATKSFAHLVFISA
eukprot:CAMPEP_0172191648 /NCGR_PEP_ID=MMETSP1050-20130122/23835_1 /TAXON_ID=233186 /ORGANISM="Cryptomonas curvata, Strain CCAP979/52" /LENGTH=97 /DNA_ID=CAMNT_0012866755 /DNA_START=83 /DNA_END=372 /DNA_ORIENTATION=-